MKTLKDIPYIQHNGKDVCLDLYLPDSDSFDLFVYFHGGGLERGDKANTAVGLFAPYLTERGVAVASLNYRIYPDAKYPDFIRDGAAGVCWLSNHIGEHGSCKRMFVGGSSAGGYLSMMLCFDGRWYAECDAFPIPIAGYFHNAGQPTCHFNVLRERGVDPKRVIIDDSAPLFHIGTAKEYPPMMIVVSDHDMQNRYEQTGLLLSTLKHFAYEESKILYRLMHGKHCAHDKQTDENGNSVLGKMIIELIEAVQ